jgi:transcriptional regulator with XRE-family HTH domain
MVDFFSLFNILFWRGKNQIFLFLNNKFFFTYPVMVFIYIINNCGKEDGLKLSESTGRIDTFANRLKKALDIRCMKKAELSRRTGINQQRIGQYVRGGYEAKHPTLYIIAKTLDVDPTWLMGYDVPMEFGLCVNKPPKKSIRKITDDELKLALFGNTEVNDEVLENIKDMAKILSKKRGAVR